MPHAPCARGLVRGVVRGSQTLGGSYTSCALLRCPLSQLDVMIFELSFTRGMAIKKSRKDGGHLPPPWLSLPKRMSPDRCHGLAVRKLRPRKLVIADKRLMVHFKGRRLTPGLDRFLARDTPTSHIAAMFDPREWVGLLPPVPDIAANGLALRALDLQLDPAEVAEVEAFTALAALNGCTEVVINTNVWGGHWHECLRTLHPQQLDVANPQIVGAFSRVRHLDLSGSPINNVQALGDVHSLNLRGCTQLGNVSALRNVHDLNLSHCTGLIGLDALTGCHKLNLSSVTGEGNAPVRLDVAPYRDVHTLILRNNCLRNVASLGGVHTLDLSHSDVSDVSALGRVQSLNLGGCLQVQDVTALRNVPRLVLHGCNSICYYSTIPGSGGGGGAAGSVSAGPTSAADAVEVLPSPVQMSVVTRRRQLQGLTLVNYDGGFDALSHALPRRLGSCSKVELQNCSTLLELASLFCPCEANSSVLATLSLVRCRFLQSLAGASVCPNLREINLSSSRVADLTPLAQLHQLRAVNLANCRRVTDVSALANVAEVSLSGCSGVTDVSCFGAGQDLLVLSSTGVVAIPETLGAIKCKLVLAQCNIDGSGLPALNAVPCLSLAGCGQVDLSLLSVLAGVVELDLSESLQLVNLDALAGLSLLKTLVLSCCDNLEDVSALADLPHLEEVNLTACSALADLTGCGGVRTVNLASCASVDDLTPLAGCKVVDLSDCCNVIDISALAAATDVDLSNCDSVTDVSALAHVGKVDLSNCRRVCGVNMLTGVRRLALSEFGNESGQDTRLTEGQFRAAVSGAVRGGVIEELSLASCELVGSLGTLLPPLQVTSWYRHNATRPHSKAPLGVIRVRPAPLEAGEVPASGRGQRPLGAFPERGRNAERVESELSFEPGATVEVLRTVPSSNGDSSAIYLELTEGRGYVPLTLGGNQPPMFTKLDDLCTGATDVRLAQRPAPAVITLRSLNLSHCRNLLYLERGYLCRLQCLTTIDLRFCERLVDARPLEACATLCAGAANLSWCKALVHPPRVRDLTLVGCIMVSGVKALAECSRLNLSECRNVTDVSALGNVEVLDLSGCSMVRDLSALNNVRELVINANQSYVGVGALRSVTKVRMVADQ